MRRSSRRAAAIAKQRVKAQLDYMDEPDHKVLSRALPSPTENIFDVMRDRLDPKKRIPLALKKDKRQAPVQLRVGPQARHVLFMNISDERILDAVRWQTSNAERPAWTNNLKGLSSSGGKLYLMENGRRLPFALKEDKRNAVKKLYFNPKYPATIKPITEHLRMEYCNISRKNVRNILRSLETYQLMFARRQPPKVEHHTLYTQPGVIAMDSFFPSVASGWQKINVLCCMDVWSRFSRAYTIEKREASLYKKAMTMFFQEITSLGILPRRLLTDKGSELHIGTELMEKYRLPKDKDAPMHLRSFTGTPVMVVEAMNAQYQRRLEPYRIAGLTTNASDILYDISESLNNQRRTKRGNYTPYQLLRLDATQRREVNNLYDRGYTGVGVAAQKRLPELKNGDHVRKLEMTYKEQVENKKKGFQEKWSRRVYEVLGKRALNRNKHVFRFQIGDPKRTYFRHELLLIPKKVDQQVIRFPMRGTLSVPDLYKP